VPPEKRLFGRPIVFSAGRRPHRAKVFFFCREML
jgi:hypothetical protein